MKLARNSNLRSCLAALALSAATLSAAEPPPFDASWITGKPETLTYRSTSKQGDGLYQLSVWRTSSGLELYMNIIVPGFTKSVWGAMSVEMRPQNSKSRIVVKDQIIMTTDVTYEASELHISTQMSPYAKTVENRLPCANLVVDFSQAPLLSRVLPLKPGVQFKFDSLNPQSNTLVPITIKVTGEETLHGIACFKLEQTDFEGLSAYWVEKEGHHRALRIDQPATGRVTELILTP